MNLVRTYIDRSNISGIGLFSTDHIKKGTLIWELNPEIDVVLTSNQFANLKKCYSKLELDFIEKYAYEMAGKIVLCADDARFANHSNTANTTSEFSKQWANRDILPGEEITCNYYEINTNFSEDEFK